MIAQNQNVVFLGDLNTRIPNLADLENTSRGVTYCKNPDNVSNTHGQELVNLCKDSNLYPVNQMVFKDCQFGGGYTFRQRQTWISQVDWVLCSQNVLPNVRAFNILKQSPIPSNHSPISLTLVAPADPTSSLVERAKLLGTYHVGPTSSRRPLRMEDIDLNKFAQILPSTESLWAGTGNDDDLCASLTDILYNTCTSAKVKNAYPQVESGPADQTALGRWRCIIQKSNPKDLWNAIAWNGTYETPAMKRNNQAMRNSDPISKLF